jgi:hypothetical protein
VQQAGKGKRLSMQDIKFLNIDYLYQGTEKQRQAALVMDDLRLFAHLAPYDPILVGTIPIGIDIPGSDLDIACRVTDFAAFEQTIHEVFGHLPDLSVDSRNVNGMDRIVVRFRYKGWMFEIFGQPVPTKQQNGYRHMVVEYRLLQLIGEAGRERIIELKQAGIKTEPAFAELLGIPGDPYAALLDMYNWSDDRLNGFYHKLLARERNEDE